MTENCTLSDCMVSARVDALEKEFDRHRENAADTHRQMFDRLGVLEQNKASIDAKLDSIDEKLDELARTVKDLADKPGKRWESLVSYALSAIVGAFLVWLASGMPGLGK